MFSITRPAPDRLARFISEQSDLPLTYREHGASLAALPAMPAGYRHDRWTADLGPFSAELLERAAQALLGWQAQRGAGLTIEPDARLRDGATFAIVIRLPVGFAIAVGRVVRVLDEPELRGFAYGTLPGHLEQGEEAFIVAREGDRLVLTVQAFSRPRHPLARLGWPVTRALQRSTNLRYLNAIRAVTAAGETRQPG